MKFATLAAIGLIALTAGSAGAATITNGSLTGQISNGGVPPGWVIDTETPDTMDQNSNVGVPGLLAFGAVPDASPDGGTWVGIGRDVGFIETFSQLVTGFTVGEVFELTWLAGNFGFDEGFGYIQPNAIEVLVDGVAVGSGATLALGSSWFAQSISLTAASESLTLGFRLAFDDRAYMSIDGIAITQPSPVPLPASAVLLVAGLAGLAGMRRKRTV